MKKFFSSLFAAAFLCVGCEAWNDESSSNAASGPAVALQGVWNFVLLPQTAAPAEYELAVEREGGSGTAQLSIIGPVVSALVTVNQNEPIPLGTCGLTVTFATPLNPLEVFYLVRGDSWSLRVSNGNPGPVIAAPGNTSITGPVTAAGTDCEPAICEEAGSALASTVPFGNPLVPGAAPGGQWHSVRLSQNGFQVSAAVAEQHVLSLYLGPSLAPPLPGLIAPGNTVTVSYRRALAADGAGGDFFRALVIHGPDMPDMEYRAESSFQPGETAVSFTFTAASSQVQLEFIAGLSQPGESVFLDDVRVTVAGAEVFPSGSELPGFEDGPGLACGPGGARWSVRRPAWAVGNVCVSVRGALRGSYSVRWVGGSERRISGAILSTSSAQNLAGLMGGGALGLLGSSGASFRGVFLEAALQQWSRFLTVFAAADTGPGSLAGTFKGESRLDPCVEMGQFTAARHQSEETNVAAGPWLVQLTGKGINCEPALAVGNTLEFETVLETLAGDTHLPVVQFGQIFAVLEPVEDDYSNRYSFRGAVSRSLVTLSLAATGDEASAAGMGVLAGNTIEGGLAGSLKFDGRVCELAEESAFLVRILPP